MPYGGWTSFAGLVGIHVKSYRAAFSKGVGATTVVHLRHDQHRDHPRHSAKNRIMSLPSGEPLSPQIRDTLLYMEFRHLTVFALYRMEIYPAQPMSGSPLIRLRQHFRNGELLEISCKTVFCQPPRFRAACNKSKSELPEFNSAEFGLIFLSPENGLFRPIPRVE